MDFVKYCLFPMLKTKILTSNSVLHKNAYYSLKKVLKEKLID